MRGRQGLSCWSSCSVDILGAHTERAVGDGSVKLDGDEMAMGGELSESSVLEWWSARA